MNRILVIRGGALGDFILTLPAIKLLRDRFPETHLEILGYAHIVALAENRFYANATRSIEAAQLARFFAKSSELPAELVDYFGRFDLIVSYLFDPDEIFGRNLRRCGDFEFIVGSPKIFTDEHAAIQLARPLETIGLKLECAAAHLFPNDADRTAASALGNAPKPQIALHPGSGSPTKNWPLERWREIGSWILTEIPSSSLLVVGGEADRSQLEELRRVWKDSRVRFAVDQPLPVLAALLAESSFFLGHDSGISHLAAAVDARCLLLFGPTDPAVWAPINSGVEVLRSRQGLLDEIAAEEVKQRIQDTLHPRPARTSGVGENPTRSSRATN